jgi:hypothetical protein
MGRGNRAKNLAQKKAGQKFAVDNESGIIEKFSDNVGILENNAIREYLIELNVNKWTNPFFMAFASQIRDILQKKQAHGNKGNELPEAMSVVLNLGAPLAEDCYGYGQRLASNNSFFSKVDDIPDDIPDDVADDWVDVANDYETTQEEGGFTVVSP